MYYIYHLIFIVLLINHEQGARINDKEKRLSPSEWFKQSKRHKRKNTLYTAIVLLVALVLLIFAVNSIKVEPVKVILETKIAFVSYLGNVTLNKHIRQTNLNDVLKVFKIL